MILFTLLPEATFSYNNFLLGIKGLVGKTEGLDGILFHNFDDTFPDTATDPEDNIALVSTKYIISFSFYIPERVSGYKCKDNLLRNRLPPCVHDYPTPIFVL